MNVFQCSSRTDCYAVQRILGNQHGHPRLASQQLVQVAKQTASARKHDAAIHNVGGQLRRTFLQGNLHRIDDAVHRIGQRFGNFR
ncbi:hypothetical protein D3C73_1557500 [compost metagenome]